MINREGSAARRLYPGRIYSRFLSMEARLTRLVPSPPKKLKDYLNLYNARLAESADKGAILRSR